VLALRNACPRRRPLIDASPFDYARHHLVHHAVAVSFFQREILRVDPAPLPATWKMNPSRRCSPSVTRSSRASPGVAAKGWSRRRTPLACAQAPREGHATGLVFASHLGAGNCRCWSSPEVQGSHGVHRSCNSIRWHRPMIGSDLFPFRFDGGAVPSFGARDRQSRSDVGLRRSDSRLPPRRTGMEKGRTRSLDRVPSLLSCKER